MGLCTVCFFTVGVSKIVTQVGLSWEEKFHGIHYVLLLVYSRGLGMNDIINLCCM